jgi:putative tryptophan/tyrosine transport system substrate-binding protein
MRRRDLLATAAGGVLWRAPARSQSRHLIGILGSETANAWAERLASFRDGLAQTGYAEGRNVEIAYRWAESRNDDLPALAADLVALKPALIAVLGGTASALAAKRATSTIPIIFRVATDPVQLGLVRSLSRPDANLTGVTTLGVELGPKQLQLLQEIAGAGPIGLLVNPTNAELTEIELRALREGAEALRITLETQNASTDRELDDAFETFSKAKVVGVVVGPDTFLNRRRMRVAELGVRHRLPTITAYREYATAGGLMSYGGSISGASRQAGVYAGRILNGERVSDLPVQQVSTVELVVNARTAKAIGISIPDAVRDRADEVIE